MDETIKQSLLAWLSGILQRSISVLEIQNGSALIQLANLTEDVHLVSPDLTSPASLEAFLNYLDTMFQFRASCLFDIPAVICGSASEEEIFGVCMLVLLCCLQSRSRQRFMDAALDLDVDVQSVIFHLVHEPMTQLSADQNLTRECVLAGFRDTAIKEETMTTMHPSTLTILDAFNGEGTPIKSAQAGKGFHQSFRGSNEAESVPDGINHSGDIFRKSWPVGQAVACTEIVNSSPVPQRIDKLDILSSSPIFRAPEPVRPKKKASETITKREQVDRSDPEHLYSEDPSDDDLIADYRQPQSSSMSYPLSSSSLPHPPPPIASGDGMPAAAGIRHQRPTDLRLMLTSQSSNCRYSRHASQSNSLVDLNDMSSGQKSHLHPPASPLATLKNLLDSPLWAQKTRLREAEREKRRLLAELDKERTYRDEVENVVTELRSQLDEARQRAAEAESRATRLSRDLVAYQDQADELNMCRTDLVMREDEITDLKKRLNSFQDVLNHSRQLELENANLHQECADHKQKIEQLSGKLNEIKDRRMVCTEVETLRSKLRDVEAQLAQQLLERENAEKDARRQQELYSQLKLQQTVQEKRRARNARYPSTGVESKTLGSQLRLGALHSGDEIECEDITLTRAGSKDSVGSTSVSSKVKVDSVPLRDGENLGSVLQSELRAAQEESSRLKNQLEETSVRLQKREWEINQLTERVQQLTVDLTSSSTQCEFTEQAAEQARATLTELKTDLSTLEGRLIWARTMNEKSMNAMRQSVSADLITRLENTGIFDRLKGIGTGLPDSLNQLCQLFTSNLDDVWALIVDQLSSLQSTMTELRSTADYLRTALDQKEEELSRVTNQLHDQSKHHAQQLAAEQGELLDMKRQFEMLKQTQCAGSQMVNDLQKQVNALMHEKQQLNKDLDRIKEQSAREMGQSKEMLERATQRLRELEEQLEVWNNRGTIDVAIQTDTMQSELPLPVDVSPLTDSLCRSDVEENERHEADDDPSVVEEQAQVAYEALAADRRGLSDELVRLHDELAESHVDRCELKQQVVDLQQKLARKEVELQRQVALYSRAQEQWLLSEREALDTRNQLAQLRTDYASKLQALRAELLPHIGRSRSEASATASHIEAVRLKYEAERDDLKNKLNKATRDLDRLEVDRSRLIELNTSLQHELTATRRWTQDMKQDLSNPMCRTSPMHERQQVARAFESILRNQRTPLEDWLEEVTANNLNHRHHNRSPRGRKTDAYDGTELSDSLSGSSSRARELEGEEDPRLTVTDTQLVNHKQRPDSSQYSRLSIDDKPGLYSRLPKQFRSRTNRRKPKRQMEEIVRQIERLASTTAELDAKACTIQQNMNMHLQRAAAPIASSTLCAMPCAQQQQQPYIAATNDPSKAHSVSLNGPSINGLDQSNAAMENPISAPVHFPSDPQQHGMPAVQSYDLDTDADSSAFTDLSQVSSASHHGHPNIDQPSSSSTHQQSPPYSMDLSQISVPHRSDSAYSSRQTRTTQPPQSLNLFTGMSQRGGEPNLKKPTATKASPIEPDPHRIAELNRRNRLQPMHLRTSYPVETQTVNPEKVASALRQLSSKTQGKEDPGCFRKPNGSVLLTTVPEEYGNVLREMGDDNIVNNSSSTRHSDPSAARFDNHGPKSGSQSERSEGTARSVRLAAGYRPVPKHLNSITDALIAASDDPSSMAAALETELARAALIGSKEETSRQSQNSAAAQSPPTVSVRSSRGSVHSDKQNSSIAFEILMEPASSKPRRLPAPRANSSDIVRRVPGSRGATTLPAPPLSQIGEGPFSSAKLPLASTLPTPLQRNPKCLNPQPSGCR